MIAPISVAPMMGCTDRHCRYLFRLIAPNSMLYSEMLTTDALVHGDTPRLLQHRDDEPCALQLGGSDPAVLAEAARLARQHGYQEVNLNCGCPSDRVQQGGIGACLMADAPRVADCYRAMQEAVSIPVTVKSRIGIDDKDSYAFFRSFIETLYEAGCRRFQVHARAAILNGLSPKENREIPPLRYEYVHRIQQELPDASFVLNGGIQSAAEAMQLLEAFPGVMLGRAPYSNPFLLAELEHQVHGTPLPARLDIARHYAVYMAEEKRRGTRLGHMAKHALGLFAGLPGARAFRRHLSRQMHREDAGIDVFEQALALVPGDDRHRETGT